MTHYMIDETQKAYLKSALQYLKDLIEYGPEDEDEESLANQFAQADKLRSQLDELKPCWPDREKLEQGQ